MKRLLAVSMLCVLPLALLGIVISSSIHSTKNSALTDIHGKPISEADWRRTEAADEKYYVLKHQLAVKAELKQAESDQKARLATPSPAPIIRDSDTVKGHEEAWVQDHTSLIAHVDPGDDRALTVTMDGDTWNSWSVQDKDLHKRGIYAQWVNAYARFHAKKWTTNSTPFSLRIIDLTGTRIASYY